MRFITTIGSGAASNEPRYFAPDSLLSLSLRSWLNSENPFSFPFLLRKAVNVTLAKNLDPSLRTRIPCSSCRPFTAVIRSISFGRPRSMSFGGKKQEKLRPNNLVGCVALDAFGTDIPTYYSASGIHHEDRVVFDSIEKQSISFFAFSNLFFSDSVFVVRFYLPAVC
jgi:hypothetical protein